MAAVRDLHRRRVRVAIGGDHFHAEALQFDRHFLCPVPRAEQQHAGSRCGDSGVRSGPVRNTAMLRDSRNAQFTRCRQCIPHRYLRCLAHAPTALPRWLACAMTMLLAGCGEEREPFARLSGLMLDDALGEVSAWPPRANADVLWMGTTAETRRVCAVEPARQPARARPGRGAWPTPTGEEAAPDLGGRHYLLVADTGANGVATAHRCNCNTIRGTGVAQDTVLRPAWSVSFRLAGRPSAGTRAAFVERPLTQDAAGLEETPYRRNCSGPAVTARRGPPGGAPSDTLARRAAG